MHTQLEKQVTVNTIMYRYIHVCYVYSYVCSGHIIILTCIYLQWKTHAQICAVYYMPCYTSIGDFKHGCIATPNTENTLHLVMTPIHRGTLPHTAPAAYGLCWGGSNILTVAYGLWLSVDSSIKIMSRQRLWC